MAKLSTLKDQLEALNTQVSKIATEVQTLKDSLEDVEIPADAQAALDNLSAALKAVDDINADAPPPPPPPPEPV